jgi:hypothetical protein
LTMALGRVGMEKRHMTIVKFDVTWCLLRPTASCKIKIGTTSSMALQSWVTSRRNNKITNFLYKKNKQCNKTHLHYGNNLHISITLNLININFLIYHRQLAGKYQQKQRQTCTQI